MGTQIIPKGSEFLLLSIKPFFSRLILREKKKIELRKRMPKKEVMYAFIYETAPTQEVTGFFKIRKIHQKSVNDLLEFCHKAHVTPEFIR